MLRYHHDLQTLPLEFLNNLEKKVNKQLIFNQKIREIELFLLEMQTDLYHTPHEDWPDSLVHVIGVPRQLLLSQTEQCWFDLKRDWLLYNLSQPIRSLLFVFLPKQSTQLVRTTPVCLQ